MARTSLVHYISPSAITIIPNCNGTADDLAVQVATGTKIRVYSKAVGLDLVNATYQEWTLKGRNRRLLGTDTNCRYTIFARLSKANVADGYVVFTPMTEETEEGGTTVGVDKYWHVTADGYSRYEDNRTDEDFDPDNPPIADTDEKKMQKDYWWFRIGWVTKPAGGLRSVYLDTGILGTEEGDETNIEEMLKKKYVTIDWFKRIFSIHGTDGKRIPKEWDESGKPVDWIHKKDEETGLDTDEYVYEGQQYDTETGELVRRDIEPNDMDHEITDTESMFGTWTRQWLSALGMGSNPGEGGGGGGALEWPLLDINVQGMPGPSDIGGPQTGDTIVYDSSLNGGEGGFKWGKTGAGLKGLHLLDGGSEIQPTISGDSYSYELGTKFLSLAHGGIVNGQVTVNGANLIVAGGTLTVSGNMLLNHADGFDPVEAANNVVLTKGEMQTLFDERYVTVAWFKKLFEARTQGGTEVKPNEDGIINNLKVLVGTWTEQYLSALGTGSQGGSGGVWYLSQLEDVNVGTLSPSDNGKALIYNSSQGRWVKGNAGMDETQLTTFLGTYTGFDTRYLTDAKLKSQYRWWGAQMDASGIVAGNMSGVGSVTAATNGASAISGFHSINLYHSGTNGAHVDFHWSTSGFTSRIIEGASGRLDLNNTIFAFHTTSNNYGGCVGIGTVTPYTNLHVSGGVRATKFYLHKPDADSDTGAVWLQYDNNGGVRLYNAGFYADTFVSALGTGSTGGGGGVDLDDVWYSLTHNEAPYANTKIHNSHLNFNTSFGSMAYESSSDYVLASEAVFAVKVNNSTYYPGAYGIVDLGTISGGGGDYLPLIGGTLTGNLRVKGAHDLSQSNNGITGSSNSYYGYYIVDANNKRSAQYINTVSPSGSNSFWMSVTYDVSGAQEQDKGFGLTVDKQGNCTWNVSDPAAFRTAIGINLDNLVTTNTVQTNISGAKTFTAATTFSAAIVPNGGITPIASGTDSGQSNTRVNTPYGGYNLWLKRASFTTDGTPNNGIVLEYGSGSTWTGQLYMADNGRDGLYWGGWYNGTREAWKKFAFTSDLDGYLPLSAGSTKKLTGSLYLSSRGKGIFMPYSVSGSSVDIPLIYDNGDNLWIGATMTTGTHHVGETFISAGTGEVYISRLIDGVRTNKKVLDVGNTYVNSGVGYINGTQITALYDNITRKFWNQTYWQNGKPVSSDVTGALKGSGSITIENTGTTASLFIAKNSTGEVRFAAYETNRGIWDGTGSAWLIGTGPAATNPHTFLMRGNVGIGTDSPSYKLDVSGTGRFSGDLLMESGKYIKFKIGSDYTSALGVWGTGYNLLQLGYYTASEKSYATNIYGNTLRLYGSATTLGMLINTSGNVGVGTDSPGAKLDVSGSLRASMFLTSWNATGSNGTVGFVHIATITVTSGWASQPLKFRVTQRGRMGGEVTVRFLNTETVANTTVDQFFYTGDIAGASIVRSGATFSLYIRKAEGYDNIGITLVDFGAYASDHFTVAWANNHWSYPTVDGKLDTSATPGNINATCRYYFDSNVYMEYDSANKGVRVYNSGLYADTYVSSLGAGSTGESGATNLLPPLDAINTLGTPTRDKSVIMYNLGSNRWEYQTISGSGSGGLSSIAMYVPTGLTVGTSPNTSNTNATITGTSGVFYLGFGTTTANRILGSGSNGVVSWRELVAADIPNLAASKITSGQFGDARISDVAWSKITGKPSTLGTGGYGIQATDPLFSNITAGKASQLATDVTLWGNSFNGTSGIGTGTNDRANLSYVENISMGGTVTGCTSIDGLLYFDTTNSRVGIGVAAPEYGLDIVGQMRLRKASNSTAALSYGVIASNDNPYIRFTDPTGEYIDISLVTDTTTSGSTIYPLRIGSTSRQTRIYGSNVRIYAPPPSGSTSNTLALTTSTDGRVLIGGTATNDTNSKLCVNGNICTSSADGTYIKIGGATLTWVAGQGLKIDTGVWSESFVSSLGTGSGGSSGFDTTNTAGVNRSNGTLLYLVGSKTYGTTGASDYDITYTSTKCYIGSDNCLYSNGSKVLTEASGGLGTDTQDTAGIYQSANEKLFLIGSKSGPSQAANAHAQTYENSACYIGTDNCLYSNSKKVLSAAGGSISSGHLYLEGAQASSATSNTTQIVFGTSSAFKVALSGINSALVINSTTSVGNNNTQIGTGSAKTYFNSTGDFIIGATSVPDNLGSPKVYVKANSCIDGYVAIGTAVNTSYKLKVSGSAYVSELKIGDNVRLYPTNVSTNADVLDISAAGLRLNGNSITSDMRKKDVVSMIGKDDLTLEAVARAPIFNFRWKQWPDGLTYVGTSAQYWQAVLPNAVLDLDNTLSLDYGATALAAVTTTARTVLTHEEEIAALKRRISDVETEYKAIKQENKQLKNEIELLNAA